MKDVYIVVQEDPEIVPEKSEYILGHAGFVHDIVDLGLTVGIVAVKNISIMEDEDMFDEIVEALFEKYDFECSLIFNLNNEYRIIPSNPEIDNMERLNEIEINFDKIMDLM